MHQPQNQFDSHGTYENHNARTQALHRFVMQNVNLDAGKHIYARDSEKGE